MDMTIPVGYRRLNVGELIEPEDKPHYMFKVELTLNESTNSDHTD